VSYQLQRRKNVPESMQVNVSSDLEELANFEINPLFYAHLVIIQIIKAPHLAFINGNDKAGIMSIILGVDQLEKIALADKLIAKEDYKTAVETAQKDVKEEKDNLMKDMRMANCKLQILLEKVFAKKLKKVDIVI
jgi:hypothetical protein